MARRRKLRFQVTLGFDDDLYIIDREGIDAYWLKMDEERQKSKDNDNNSAKYDSSSSSTSDDDDEDENNSQSSSKKKRRKRKNKKQRRAAAASSSSSSLSSFIANVVSKAAKMVLLTPLTAVARAAAKVINGPKRVIAKAGEMMYGGACCLVVKGPACMVAGVLHCIKCTVMMPVKVVCGVATLPYRSLRWAFGAATKAAIGGGILSTAIGLHPAAF